MRTIVIKIAVTGIFFFGSLGNIEAQIFEQADDQETQIEGTDREVFASDPIFTKKGGISKRGSGTFDSGLTFGGNVPIDGGLGIFVGGLLGYGIKKMKKRRRTSDV